MKSLVVVVMLLIALSCSEKEESCWVCSMHKWQKVHVPPGDPYPFAYFGYVHIGSEIFCEDLPVSDPLYGPGIQYYCILLPEPF